MNSSTKVALFIVWVFSLSFTINCQSSMIETLSETSTVAIKNETIKLENPKHLDELKNNTKGGCSAPFVEKGTFASVQEKNVTENETYFVGAEAVYKCTDNDDHFIDFPRSNEYSRFCDAVTKNWNGTTPKCSSSDIRSRFKVPLFSILTGTVCLIALLIFVIGYVIIYKKFKIAQNKLSPKPNDVERPIKSTFVYGELNSFRETPNNDLEYATIHKFGQRDLRKTKVDATVRYSKIVN